MSLPTNRQFNDVILADDINNIAAAVNTIGRGTQLTTEHLDSVVTPGPYWTRTNSEATLENGYPVAAFGTMQVFTQHQATASLTQVYYPNQYWATGFYVRSRYNEAWGAWKHYLDVDQMLNRVNRGTQLTTEHLDSVTTPGRYWTRQNTEATPAKGYPFEAYGSLVVSSDSTNDANVTQVYTPSQRWASGFAVRSRYNGAWQPWQFFDTRATNDTRYAPASVAQVVDGMVGRVETSSGLKTVPLALTTGQSQFQDALTGSVRIPIRFNAPITRFRLHIRPWNPRLGQVTTAAVDFTGLWLAQTPQQALDTSYGQITGTPTHLYQGFTIPAGGSEWVSDWWDATIDGDQQRLLCFGYTTTAAPWGNLGGSWQNNNPADATNPSASMARSITIPFDMWLEAETPSATPVIAGIGDSLTSGWGADYPVYESWLSQYTRRVGALPVHHSHSGDSMEGFRTVNPGKVTRWAGLSRADAVVWGLGSNDISGGRTVEQMQADYAALLPVVEANIGPVRYVSTVQPRQMWDATTETKRTDWNTWLTGRPGVRDVLDFAAVVSTDGDTLLPQYDSGDGTHLNTAGYAAEAASITVPLTSPPPRTDAADLAEYLAARGA